MAVFFQEKQIEIVDTSDCFTSLTLTSASREDTGTYAVTIENSEGTADFVFKVKVGTFVVVSGPIFRTS